MNTIAARLSELVKAIKAPKYFMLGLVILFSALVLLPVLKLLAIIFAAMLIFIGINPEHDISKYLLSFIKKSK